MIDIVDRFTVDQNAINVALVRFDNNAELRFSFDTDYTRIGIQRLINNLVVQYQGGISNTAEGFRMVRDRVLSSDRRNSPNVIVLITDGRNGDGDNPISIAQDLKADGTTILCFGVGVEQSSREYSELVDIASTLPSTSVWLPGSYGEMKSSTFVNACVRAVCAVGGGGGVIIPVEPPVLPPQRTGKF